MCKIIFTFNKNVVVVSSFVISIFTKIVTMKLLILIINLSAISCQINITETAVEIQRIINKYKNNKLPRCVKSDKMESFVDESIDIFEKNTGLSEFWNTLNISECMGDTTSDYIRSHILKGLIVHDDLPVTHWEEYKVSSFSVLFIVLLGPAFSRYYFYQNSNIYLPTGKCCCLRRFLRRQGDIMKCRAYGFGNDALTFWAVIKLVFY